MRTHTKKHLPILLFVVFFQKIETESECGDSIECTKPTIEDEVMSLSSGELSVVRKKIPQKLELNITPPSRVITKREQDCTDQAIEEPQNIARQSEDKPKKDEDNEFDCFAKSVACQLKKLPESVALKSMAYIQSYLVQQRLAQLASK